MKLVVLTWSMVLAGAMAAFGQQAQPTNNVPLRGSAIGTAPGGQLSPNLSQRVVVSREQRYQGGVIGDLAKGRSLLGPISASPIKNPERDLTTGRPRGVVLFSLSF